MSWHHTDLMQSIASDPDVLDLIDEELDGELWEDVKEFVSANPDVLDHLDAPTVSGIVDWTKRAYRYVTGKKEKKKKHGEDGEEDEDEEGSVGAFYRSSLSPAVARASYNRAKLLVMQDPDVLDRVGQDVRDSVWQTMKGFIAANPEVVHSLPCFQLTLWSETKEDGTKKDGFVKKLYKKGGDIIKGDRHGYRHMSEEELQKKYDEKKKTSDTNKRKKELIKKIHGIKSNLHDHPDTIAIRVPTYGAGEERLSASLLQRYA